MGLNFSETPGVLNFIITGQTSSGNKLLQAALNNYELPNHSSPITCHSALLSDDAAVRRYYHELYFGPSGNTPDWLVEGHISGEQYLTNKIFDNNLLGEKAIGVCVLYPHMYARDLWDYFIHWCRVGDFCVVSLDRNPFSCFACLKLWERDNHYLREITPPSYRTYTDVVGHECPHYSHFPPHTAPVHVDVQEAITFVRAHVAAKEKTDALCDDRLEISYRELTQHFYATSEELLRFLNLPLNPSWSSAWDKEYRKTPATPVKKMIANWATLRMQLPDDIAELADPEAL